MAPILLVLALQTQMMGSPVTGPQATGSIAGAVRDTAGHPLADAVVSIAAASRHVRTDSLGRYRMDEVPVGSVDLMAWALQHKTTQVVAVVRRDARVNVDFVLHQLDATALPARSANRYAARVTEVAIAGSAVMP